MSFFICMAILVIYQLPRDFCTSLTVLIDSPSAALTYFLDVKESLDDSFAEDFKTMSIDHMKNLCQKMLANPVSFFEDPRREDLIQVYGFTDQINETFVKYTTDKLFLPELRFTYEGSEFMDGIPAHICVIEGTGTEWAVAIVTHEDTLLLFRKPVDSELFEISGLLESIPTGSSQAELKYLEKKQLASQKRGGESAELIAWNRNDSMSFHRLNSHIKFRLCSLAYVALMVFEQKNCLKSNNIVHHSEVTRNAKILVNTLTKEDKLTTIPADLIPCAVNEDAQNPSLFVTNDPSSMESAFILKPVQKNDKSSKGQKYSLVLYLEKVTALKFSRKSEIYGGML